MSRPTPETDALDRELHNPRVLQDQYSEMMEHARRLERERNEARERIERQKLEINRLNGATNHAGGTPLKIALRERDEAREKAERYRLEANAIMLQRDEALMDRANGDIATMTINHYERILREREEWKNKAYSHATDYTLMEAKCFRLEQQLKEYDQLKS
jgi:hypothetical protein